MRLMIHTTRVAVWLLPALMAPFVALAQATLPKGDAVAGQDKADAERCIECHGMTGHGAGHANGAEGRFAKLAGQHPEYIVKQIQDFRSGARRHDQMAIMARSISDEDLVDIAAYFGSLPAMKGEGAEVPELGKRLYLSGDAARGIVACVSCHGDKGKGVAGMPLSPVLGGQAWRYLEQQLLDWRSGTRRNARDGVMTQVTRHLTDAEVQALTTYLASF